MEFRGTAEISDEVSANYVPERYLTYWETSLVADEGNDVVAVARAIVVDTNAMYNDGVSPTNVLDDVSADLAEYCCLFDDDSEPLELLGLGAFVILDRVRTSPHWRGRRFGPLLAALTLKRVDIDLAFAAAIPAPFEMDDHGSPAWKAEQTHLRSVWTTFGFSAVTDDVFILDLRTQRLEMTYRQLLADTGAEDI